MDFNATIFFLTGDLFYVVTSNLKKSFCINTIIPLLLSTVTLLLTFFPFLYRLTNANIRNIKGLLLKLNPSMFSTPLEAPELSFFFFLYKFPRMLVVAAVNFCFSFLLCRFFFFI